MGKMNLSYSKIEAFARCPLYYALNYEDKIESTKVKVALKWGDAYQQGITKLYDTEDVNKAVAKFVSVFTPFDGMDEKGVRTLAKGQEMLEAWNEQFYGKEEWTDQGGEKMFSFEVVPGLFYTVKLDRQGLSGGVEAIQEIKTTGYPGMFVTEPNLQIQGYLYAYSHLKGVPVKKAVVTVAGLYKSSSRGMVKGTRKDDPPRSVFGRDNIWYEEWQFEQWKKAVKKWARLIQVCQEDNDWPINAPSACSAYGGCQYRVLCSADPEQREYLKETAFKKKEEA